MEYTINIIDDKGNFHQKETTKNLEDIKLQFDSVKETTPLILIITGKEVQFYDYVKKDWTITLKEYFGLGCIYGYNIISEQNRMGKGYYNELMELYKEQEIDLLQYIPTTYEGILNGNIKYLYFLRDVFVNFFGLTHNVIDECYTEFLLKGEVEDATFGEYFTLEIENNSNNYGAIHEIVLNIIELIINDIDSNGGESVDFLHEILDARSSDKWLDRKPKKEIESNYSGGFGDIYDFGEWNN